MVFCTCVFTKEGGSGQVCVIFSQDYHHLYWPLHFFPAFHIMKSSFFSITFFVIAVSTTAQWISLLCGIPKKPSELAFAAFINTHNNGAKATTFVNPVCTAFRMICSAKQELPVFYGGRSYWRVECPFTWTLPLASCLLFWCTRLSHLEAC